MAITTRALQAACAPLLAALVSEGHADRSVLEATQPRGRSVDAWHRFYVNLRCQHAVAMARGGADGRGGRDQDAETALAQSRLDAPHPVTFADGETRAVHPKGIHALEWLNSLDRQYVDTMAAVAAQVAQGHVPDAVVLAPLVESLAIRLWAWILTSPGAGLPFDESGAAPEPPAFTARMTIDDVVKLYRGHVHVHGRRLQLMGALFPPDPATATSRATLAGFVGAYAHDKGLYGPDVLRRWSVGAVYAQALDGLRAHDDAERAAKARAAQEP